MHHVPVCLLGYKPIKISTVVDKDGWQTQRYGYKPIKISTVVDRAARLRAERVAISR